MQNGLFLKYLCTNWIIDRLTEILDEVAIKCHAH